ncbi:458_t:CDS:1, partial [Funneliformis geosporum]
ESIVFYSYLYPYIDGCICGNRCYRQEECHIHWKRQFRIPCGKCDTPTTSSYGMYVKHAGKYYSKANYYKNKLSSPTTSVSNPNRSDKPREQKRIPPFFFLW